MKILIVETYYSALLHDHLVWKYLVNLFYLNAIDGSTSTRNIIMNTYPGLNRVYNVSYKIRGYGVHMPANCDWDPSMAENTTHSDTDTE